MKKVIGVRNYINIEKSEMIIHTAEDELTKMILMEK